MFFVVINHFQSAQAQPHLLASTLLSAALAVRAEEVATVLVVDGSEEANPDLEKHLRLIGIHYRHEGRRLSFSEGYNVGLRLSDQPWTILCASDVYPSLTIFAEIAAVCAQTQRERIGCLLPRLTASDLPLQSERSRSERLMPVPLMTLNFNVFPTDYLRGIGGIPTEFNGNYNDVLLAARIVRDGREMILLPGRCVHYGSLTLGSGVSEISLQRDVEKLATTYPELYDRDGFWNLRLRRFVRHRLARAVLFAFDAVVPRKKRHTAELVLRYLTRAGLA